MISATVYFKDSICNIGDSTWAKIMGRGQQARSRWEKAFCGCRNHCSRSSFTRALIQDDESGWVNVGDKHYCQGDDGYGFRGKPEVDPIM